MRSLLVNLNFSTVPAVSFPVAILNLFRISLGSAAFALQHHDAPHTQAVMHTWLASPVTGLAERLINPQFQLRCEFPGSRCICAKLTRCFFFPAHVPAFYGNSIQGEQAKPKQ